MTVISIFPGRGVCAFPIAVLIMFGHYAFGIKLFEVTLFGIAYKSRTIFQVVFNGDIREWFVALT